MSNARFFAIRLLCAVAGGMSLVALGALSGESFRLIEAGVWTLFFLAIAEAADLHGRIKSAWVQAATAGVVLGLLQIALDVVRSERIDLLTATLWSLGAAVSWLLLLWAIDRLGRWVQEYGRRQELK